MSRLCRGIYICSFAASAPSIDKDGFSTTSSHHVLIGGRWMLKARHFRLPLPLQIPTACHCCCCRLTFLSSPRAPIIIFSQWHASHAPHPCRKHENPFWDPFPELSDTRRDPCITRGLLLVRLFSFPSSLAASSS